MQGKYVIPFSELRYTDVNRVGGKNASLGELLSQLTSAGIRVPNGFATTADAFRLFLKESNLNERINKRLESLDVEDVNELAKAGAEIRQWVEEAPFPAELEKEIREYYDWLRDGAEISVAVRSFGDCRRSSGRFVRRSAGNLPQCERNRSGSRPHEGSVRFALQRPRYFLSRSEGFVTLKWRFPPAFSVCAAPIRALPA